MTTLSTNTETPKSVKIWGHHYKVQKKKDPKYWNGSRTMSALGLFCSDKQEIILSKAMEKTPTKEAETLIHEILHGIFYSSNVLYSVENKGDLEEHLVDTLANALALVFKDNPELLDYLKKTLNEV